MGNPRVFTKYPSSADAPQPGDLVVLGNSISIYDGDMSLREIAFKTTEPPGEIKANLDKPDRGYNPIPEGPPQRPEPIPLNIPPSPKRRKT